MTGNKKNLLNLNPGTASPAGVDWNSMVGMHELPHCKEGDVIKPLPSLAEVDMRLDGISQKLADGKPLDPADQAFLHHLKL